MNDAFKLEEVVAPAEWIKFRQEIHNYRCMDTELLFGQQVIMYLHRTECLMEFLNCNISIRFFYPSIYLLY